MGIGRQGRWPLMASKRTVMSFAFGLLRSEKNTNWERRSLEIFLHGKKTQHTRFVCPSIPESVQTHGAVK